MMTPEQRKQCMALVLGAMQKLYKLPDEHPLRIEWKAVLNEICNGPGPETEELRARAIDLCERIIAT